MHRRKERVMFSRRMHRIACRVLFTALSLIIVAACERAAAPTRGDPSRKADSSKTAQVVGRAVTYADTTSIAARADSIDAAVKVHPDRLVLFAKVSGREALVAVKNSRSWPESTEVSYNTFGDSAGHLLMHMQVPASESGDWFAEETHYFASDGHTILHQYEVSGFASGCSEILHELRRTFLGPSGNVLAETRRYSDAKGAAVVADTCYRRSDDAPSAKLRSAELPSLAVHPK